MYIAILDFGTNTFNLLIANAGDDNKLNIIHTSKQAVKLGKGGINKGIIQEDAFERGLKAIENHLITIRQYPVKKIYAFATSAIRSAANGKDFVNEVKKRYDIYVNTIPGEREAELIYKGVRQSLDLGRTQALILDIGGGSNEFIIADNKKISWKHSYDLGMARMLEKFKPHDPIKTSEIIKIEAYFEKELQSLFDAVQIYEPAYMIGASGSFETFSALLAGLFPEKYKLNPTPVHEIYPDDYRKLHNILISSTIETRKQMPGMEPVRVEMIVLASIFVNFTIAQCKFEKVLQSDYSLKEGIIAEMLNI